jgi:hypothetical protein
MVNDILAGVPWGIFLSFMIGPVFLFYLKQYIKGFRAAIVLIWCYFGRYCIYRNCISWSYRLIQSLKINLRYFFWRHIDARIWCNFFY